MWKILYEIFSRMHPVNFEIIYISQCNDIHRYIHDISDDDMFVFSSPLSRMEQRDYCTKLINFKENLARRSDLRGCWLSLLDVIEIFLNLINVITQDIGIGMSIQ